MMIHLNHNGHQMGTFSRQQVEAMIQSGAITYETLAWTDGQTTWKPLRHIIGASVPPPPPPTHVASSKAMNPVLAYFVPVGRVGRGEWFLRNLAHFFGAGLLVAPFFDSHSDGAALWIVMVFCLWLYLIIVNVGKRLHDLNASAWFSFVIFLPFVPLILLILSGTKGPNKYGPERL